jgi:hypothetical protein
MARIPLGIETDSPKNYQSRLNNREKKVAEAVREDVNIEDVFDSPMVVSGFLDSGLLADSTLAAGEVLAMQTRSAHYTCNVQSVNGTVVNTVPTVVSTGLELEIAAATNSVIGWELSPGSTHVNSYAGQTIGSLAGGKDVFFEVKMTCTTIANVNEFIVGWRKSAVAIAEFDDYTDFAALRIDASADVQAETILNNAGALTADTTINAADATQIILRIEIDQAGRARFIVDGVDRSSVIAKYTFDSGDVVIPFIHLKTDTGDPVVVINSLKCGTM